MRAGALLAFSKYKSSEYEPLSLHQRILVDGRVSCALGLPHARLPMEQASGLGVRPTLGIRLLSFGISRQHRRVVAPILTRSRRLINGNRGF